MADKISRTQNASILKTVHSPEDLKAVPEEKLSALSEEIRKVLIERVSENGGHLASNLGVVELTVAIHRVFSCPKDHIIFDVGHQSYVHKLLTGRQDAFETLRQPGGISGFPKRSESEYDCFGTGHSSTSLSAALGFAESDKLQGSEAYTVCVLGDGAYTGGMIHEALNNTKKKLRLVIVINENEMSISKNIGRFARTLSKIRTAGGYLRTKNATNSVLRHIPLIGKPLHWLISKMTGVLRSQLYGSNYFENLGLKYFGPVDGNNEKSVERLLREAKKCKQSCVVHVKTQKGKGYLPAETNPDKYHGMAPANAAAVSDVNFSETMGTVLSQMAEKDPKICAITAAMASGTGLLGFKEAHPERFFDVGIAEEHAVTFAAGLAANGYKPFVALYSTFLQRAYDNILHDVALQNLPVTFCIDRAGLNRCDGATHHGIFDVAFLSEIPDMQIFTPITKQALRRSLEFARHAGTPVAIRYPSGYENPDVLKAFYQNQAEDSFVKADYLAENKDSLEGMIITDGRIVTEALKAKNAISKKVGVILLEKIKPYEEIALQIEKLLPKNACKILLLEEEIKEGGMGMMLKSQLETLDTCQNKKFIILAPSKTFCVQTKKEPIWKTAGIDAEAIQKVFGE